ncbi:MAG: hypothetical protein LBS28_00760 [Streptococcaceae bacterium]|jgi:hypothetical protein|nr:hypothetical protein [Streptococcaceae bacterium]
MVTNSLTKLLTSNPSIGEQMSKLTTKEEILALLKKHIPGYTEEQMVKDFTETKASMEIVGDEALDTEALEKVAGGSAEQNMAYLSMGLQAIGALANLGFGIYGQYKAMNQGQPGQGQ